MFTPTSIVSARRWFTPDCVTHQEPVALARDSATYDELGRRRGFRQPVPYHHRELFHVQVQHQRHIRYVNRLSINSRFVIERVNDGQGRIGTIAISRLNTATGCEDLWFCTTGMTPTRACTTSMMVRITHALEQDSAMLITLQRVPLLLWQIGTICQLRS